MKDAVTVDYMSTPAFPKAHLEKKADVLEFMRSFTPFCAAAGEYTDAITGEYVSGSSWGVYRAGGWRWDDRDAYHVEKYDLQLEPEFVAYALKR